ncbi:MAG: hypothetical protein GXP55_09075 [Deltaproteobacteria bacterium]|nr:hypothetical protein [Deltaproteobacteria bacterium]
MSPMLTDDFSRSALRTRVGLSMALLTGLLSSCAADKPAVDSPVLADPSKADSAGADILPIGAIAYGGDVTGDFTREDQLDGYSFRAEAGSVVTLDNSNRGTARRLDSTLFLYGPKNADGFYGAQSIAFDDDGGWSLHARIRDFTIPTRGEYLAVMGTYAGADRGHYRLGLICESGDCEPPVEPPPTGDAGLVVDTTRVDTREDGGSQTFQVSLSAEPEFGVQVWIESDDLTEAVVFPSRIFFCARGYRESNIGCELIPEGESLPEPHWQRTVEVRVTGVRDEVADGDTPFSLNFRLESADDRYRDLTPAPIEGVNADVTTGPDYSDLDGLSDADLLAALYARTQGQTVYGYHGVNSARTLLFGSVDVRDGLVASLYTGRTIEAPGESILAYMRGFNTEHSWPQAQFDRLDPMVSDLHHIFAVDTRSNSDRSSYNYGFNTSSSNPSSRLGLNVTGTGRKVYQVRPERRGDVARAHFYMVARYALDDSLGVTFDDDGRPADGSIQDDEEAVLRQWNDEDPVDAWEMERNDRVEAFQGNRNPFIDRPDLVARISDF